MARPYVIDDYFLILSLHGLDTSINDSLGISVNRNLSSRYFDSPTVSGHEESDCTGVG